MIFYQGGFPYSLKIGDFPIPYSLKKIQEIETRQCLEGVQRRIVKSLCIILIWVTVSVGSVYVTWTCFHYHSGGYNLIFFVLPVLHRRLWSWMTRSLLNFMNQSLGKTFTLQDHPLIWLALCCLQTSLPLAARRIIALMMILERMRAPVRHISYGIRHCAVCTALWRMYDTITMLVPLYYRYSSTSPLTWIVSAPDKDLVRMEPAYLPISLIQNTWMWKIDRQH